MIGLDSNILVRHITQDDPVNSPKASAFIERRLTIDEPGYISIVSIAEIVWVLGRSYGFSATQIASAVQQILATETFVVEDEQDVSVALKAFKVGQADFSDALIEARCRRAGCTRTVTFDRKAARLPGFELLS